MEVSRTPLGAFYKLCVDSINRGRIVYAVRRLNYEGRIVYALRRLKSCGTHLTCTASIELVGGDLIRPASFELMGDTFHTPCVDGTNGERILYALR